MAVYGCVWLCMAMYGYVGLCMAVYGYVGLCMAVCFLKVAQQVTFLKLLR